MPLPIWQDPFRDGLYAASTCSAGAMLVISDVNPNFDTDQVPGSAFSSFTDDLPGLNAQANAVWVAEHGAVTRQHFIGQVGSNTDGAPSEKAVSGLGNIRGLAPSEPTKQGGYYSAAVAGARGARAGDQLHRVSRHAARCRTPTGAGRGRQ